MKEYKYFYKGVSLADYCKSHHLVYSVINSRIYRLRNDEKYDNYTIEEIIEVAINIKSSCNHYFYKGIPLSQYCKDNGLDYHKINSRIQLFKKDSRYKSMTIEEIIEKAINHNKSSAAQYFYKGMSLRVYCQNNNLKFSTILARVHKFETKQEYKEFPMDELIELAINQPSYIKYSYKGISLCKYCKENNINYIVFLRKVRKLSNEEKYKNCNFDEIVELAFAKLTVAQYFYKGETLYSYCQKYNINYRSCLTKIRKLKKSEEYRNYDNNEIVEIALNSSDKDKRVSYRYNGISLSQYCKENNYSLFSIKERIKKYKKENDNASNEEIVEMAINNYKKTVREIKMLKEIKDNKFKFNISYWNLKLLMRDLEMKKAVNLICYFGDEVDELGNRFVSEAKFKQLKEHVDNIEECSKKLDLYYLIGLYKSGLHDTREIILKKEEKYLKKIMFKICDSYDIDIDDGNREDFESEIVLALMTSLEKVDSDNEREVLSYIDNYVQNKFEAYVLDYSMNSENVRFDENIHSCIG